MVRNKENILNLARKVNKILLDNRINSFFDIAGSIGKRYRRQDELGTPFCVTIDYESLEDDTVTVRFRDSMEQIRVKIGDLADYINENLG